MNVQLHRLAPITFLILLVLVPHWRLATMQGVVITDDIFTSDLMNDGFPYRHFLGSVLGNGELPLWYPPVYGGFPLLARAESGVASPVNLLLFGLLPPYTALNIVILLTMITGGVGMYLLARRLGAGVPGSVIGGMGFAYSGFMVSHLKHLSMVGTVSLFPIALLLLERGLSASADGETKRFRSSLLWFAAVFGLQNLSGHIQTAYYSALVYVFYCMFRLLLPPAGAKGAKRGRGRTGLFRGLKALNRPAAIWCTGALILGGVGISAVQIVPTYELVSLSQRSGGVDFAYASDYRYDPANAVTFLYPPANGEIADGTYRGRGIFWEDYGYVGVITILLACAGAVTWWKEWHGRFFTIGLATAYLLVLGPNTPVYELVFRFVPGMQYFRFPTRFLFIVDAFLVLLAARGATWFLSRPTGRTTASGNRPVLAPSALLLVALVAADLLYFQLRQNAVVDGEAWMKTPRTAQLLREDPTLFRIYTPGATDAHKAAFAQARGWGGDLTPYLRQREFLQPSSNVLYGISSADGYAQLTPTYVVDVWGDQNRSGLIYSTAGLQEARFHPTPAFMRIMNMFNVKYILSLWPFASGYGEPVDVIDGVHIIRNPGVLGRARLVPSFRVASTPAEALAALRSPQFDPSREVLLASAPAIRASDGPAGSAMIEQYRTNEVIVRVQAPGERLLVLADTWYPGWKADIDGREIPILRGNLSQRVVAVPAGAHVVRFSFVSATAMWGGVVTLFSILLLGAAFIMIRRTTDV